MLRSTVSAVDVFSVLLRAQSRALTQTGCVYFDYCRSTSALVFQLYSDRIFHGVRLFVELFLKLDSFQVSAVMSPRT